MPSILNLCRAAEQSADTKQGFTTAVQEVVPSEGKTTAQSETCDCQPQNELAPYDSFCAEVDVIYTCHGKRPGITVETRNNQISRQANRFVPLSTKKGRDLEKLGLSELFGQVCENAGQ